jgi:hypothetical protein
MSEDPETKDEVASDSDDFFCDNSTLAPSGLGTVTVDYETREGTAGPNPERGLNTEQGLAKPICTALQAAVSGLSSWPGQG